MPKSVKRRTCSVPFCKSSQYEKLSFFQFPSKLEKRAAWISAISQAAPYYSSVCKLTDYAVVCEKHFDEAYFSKSTKKKILLPHAVLSVDHCKRSSQFQDELSETSDVETNTTSSPVKNIFNLSIGEESSSFSVPENLQHTKDCDLLGEEEMKYHETLSNHSNSEVDTSVLRDSVITYSRQKDQAATQTKVCNCCVAGCYTGYKSDLKKQHMQRKRPYELFLPPENLYEQWKRNVPVKGKEFTRSHPVCELHFAEKYLERTDVVSEHDNITVLPKQVILKHGAIPTIFPKHCKRKNPKKKLSTNSTSFDESSNYSKILDSILGNNSIVIKVEPSDAEVIKTKLQSPEGVFLSSLLLNCMFGGKRNSLGSSPNQNPLIRIMKFLDRPCSIDSGLDSSNIPASDIGISESLDVPMIALSECDSTEESISPRECLSTVGLIHSSNSVTDNVMQVSNKNKNAKQKPEMNVKKSGFSNAVVTTYGLSCSNNFMPSSSQSQQLFNYNLISISPFKDLRNSLEKLKLPPNWHVIQHLPSMMACVKWNQNFVAERRFSIDWEFKLKVFLGHREVYLMQEVPKTSQGVLALLQRIDSLHACKGCCDREVPDCLAVLSTEAITSPDRRGFCDNCFRYRKRKAQRMWQKVSNHFIYEKKGHLWRKDCKKFHKRSSKMQRTIDKLERQLKIEKACSSEALEFFT